MSRRFAVNSSPLILLGRISRLDLLPALADQVVVPRSVLPIPGSKLLKMSQSLLKSGGGISELENQPL